MGNEREMFCLHESLSVNYMLTFFLLLRRSGVDCGVTRNVVYDLTHGCESNGDCYVNTRKRKGKSKYNDNIVTETELTKNFVKLNDLDKTCKYKLS